MWAIARTRWAAIGAAVAVSLGAGGIGLGQAAVGTGDRPVYIALDAPCRLVDTRPATQIGPKNTPIGAGEPNAFEIQVTGANGNCTGPLAVPTDAVAVAMNVTAIAPDAPSGRSYFTLYPANAPLPTTSNLNFLTGQPPVPNKVDVGLSDDGKIKLYNNDGTAHAAVDIFGYYTDHHHDDRYYTEAEVDALVASIPTGPAGPEGPPGPAGTDAGSYEHQIVVAQDGGDFTSVTAAMNAIGTDPEYPAASASERYLVWVAPGVYENEDVDMHAFVDIEGSGQGVTVLRSSGGAGGITPDAATLVGANDAELRHLTVEIEAAAPANWTHAIYTTGTTRLRNVTAVATGGTHPRGLMIDAGAAPILIDVIARATGGSNTNTAVDVFGATALADGLYAEASGGFNARGIYVNGASSEVILENVTTVATGGSDTSHGINANNSDVTVEGLRTIVNTSTTNAAGIWCTGGGQRLQVLGGVFDAENSQAGGSSRGLYVIGCDLELRNAVVDVVSAGFAGGVQHFQPSTTEARVITISDVEARVEASGAGAIGLGLLETSTTPADTTGRITDVNIRATGGAPANNTFGILHDTVGGVHYRDVSIIVGGSANFMYGIQAVEGTSRFDQISIDAVGAAGATVVGVELFGDGSTFAHGRVRAVNTGTGSGHDAVGIKANSGTGIAFADVVADAEAETNVWGFDLTNAGATLTRVSATAVGVPGNTVRGGRCMNGTVDVHDSVLEGGASGVSSVGLFVNNCSGTATGTEFRADPTVASSYGFYATSSGVDEFRIRESLLAGGLSSIRTLGDVDVTVVSSSLEGGAGSSGSASDVQECTAVTTNSGGSDVFQAATSDPCP